MWGQWPWKRILDWIKVVNELPFLSGLVANLAPRKNILGLFEHLGISNSHGPSSLSLKPFPGTCIFLTQTHTPYCKNTPYQPISCIRGWFCQVCNKTIDHVNLAHGIVEMKLVWPSRGGGKSYLAGDLAISQKAKAWVNVGHLVSGRNWTFLRRRKYWISLRKKTMPEAKPETKMENCPCKISCRIWLGHTGSGPEHYGLLVCWRSNPANYLEGEINLSWRADTLFWQDSRDPHVCVQDLAPIFHCGIICNVGPPNDRITLVDAQAS